MTLSWASPRRVDVVVDNPSWILDYASELTEEINARGDDCRLLRRYEDIAPDTIIFLLGCTKIAPPSVLSQSFRTLVVHESSLPLGRGFSPTTWQVLEGKAEIPICLIEASVKPDEGPVIFSRSFQLDGHELVDEIREKQAQATIELCLGYLAAPEVPRGTTQTGETTWYPRRRPQDSRLDLNVPLADQLDLLRVVDNERYPAFFETRGHKYVIKVYKASPPKKISDPEKQK